MTKSLSKIWYAFALFLTVFTAIIFAGCAGTPPAPAETKVSVDAVTLNETTKTMTVGDVFQFVATISPTDATNKAVTWSITAGDSFATVDTTGKVRALAVGTATLTATSKDDVEKFATCQITVIPAPIRVESVAINNYNTTDKALKVQIGESKTVTAQVLPANADNKRITWSVDPQNLVELTPSEDTLSVSVKGLVNGEAIVTATTEDGDKTATFKVNVPDINATAIKLAEGSNVSAAELAIVAQPTSEYTLTLSVEPSNTTDIFDEVVIAEEYKDSISVTIPNGAMSKIQTITISLNNAAEGTVDLIFKSKQTPTVLATVHLTIMDNYAMVGESKYTTFAEAYQAAALNDTIVVHGTLTVDAPVVIGEAKWVSISGPDGMQATLLASENFVGENLLVVNTVSDSTATARTIQNLILDANSKARVVKIDTNNALLLTLKNIEVKNGYVYVDSTPNDSAWTPGILIDGESQVEMYGVISKLDSNPDFTESTPNKYNHFYDVRKALSRDLNVGTQAVVRLRDDCKIGRAMVRASGTDSDIKKGILCLYFSYNDTAERPEVDSVFLLSDENRSYQDYSTRGGGAKLYVVSGIVKNLYFERIEDQVSKKFDNETYIVKETGFLRQARYVFQAGTDTPQKRDTSDWYI